LPPDDAVTWHLVTPEHPPRIGGIASWTDDVARALHAAGHAVVVWSRGPVEARPWPVHAVPGRSWGRWGGAWMAAWVGPRLARGDRILVTNWELAAGPLGGLLGAARRAGARLDVVWHGSDIVQPERRPAGGIGRATFAHGVLAQGGRHYTVSGFLAGRLETTHGVAAQVLPAPIDPEPPVARGARWIVVTRLVPGKGVAQALAFAAAHGRGLTIVGDGPERALLESRAAALGLDARFVGARPRVDVPWAGH
jgi:glycosyltransferase involved in cell wall biosynthesis